MEREIAQLKEQLAARDENLILAGKFGSELLERYHESLNESDKTAKEHASEKEKLLQKKYALELKLKQKIRSESDILDELENLKLLRNSELEDFQLQLKIVNQQEIALLSKKLSASSWELETSMLREKQLKENNAELAILVQGLQTQAKQQLNAHNETTSDEMMALQQHTADLQHAKVVLQQELRSEKDRSEYLCLQVQNLETCVQRAKTDLDEQQCQATSYYNALEKARTEIKDLRAQIDALSMESQNQKKKGNSLFAEVEDRRVDAEKKLISVKVENEWLRKQHETARQQLQRLKMQLAGLLQMCGHQADSEHIERLEKQLEQARTQIIALTASTNKLRQQEITISSSQHRDAITSSIHGEHYEHFLKALLEKKEIYCADMEKEVSSKKLMLLAQNDKLLECERKLYSTERQLQACQAQSLKLSVSLHELRSKYGADHLATNKNTCRNILTESIPRVRNENNETNLKTTEDSDTALKTAVFVDSDLKNSFRTGNDNVENTDPNHIKREIGACCTLETNKLQTCVLQEEQVADDSCAPAAFKSVEARHVTLSEQHERQHTILEPSQSAVATQERLVQPPHHQHKKIKVLEQQENNACQTQ